MLVGGRELESVKPVLTRHDRKLRLLAAAVSDFESQFGEITAEEIVGQQRLDRERATIVR